MDGSPAALACLILAVCYNVVLEYCRSYSLGMDHVCVCVCMRRDRCWLARDTHYLVSVQIDIKEVKRRASSDRKQNITHTRSISFIIYKGFASC